MSHAAISKSSNKYLADTALGRRVQCWTLESQQPPLFISPVDDSFTELSDFIDWLKGARATLDALIIEFGGIVLRGFPIATTEDFATASACFPAYTGGYQGGASPRLEKQAGVYEATQMSGRHTIPLHQEMFYIKDYPARIAFFARKIADEGGETTIGDMREFSRRIPDDLRVKMETNGIQNIRNFAAATGNRTEAEHADRRGWDFAFYTESKDEVEEVCRRRGMTPVWNADGSLTTFNLLSAFEVHPITGQRLYRAAIHNSRYLREPARPGGLADRVRKAQVHETGIALGGDTDIDLDELTILERLADDVKLVWPWENGDLMILDNLQIAHGRNPFKGERETLVAMFDR